MKKVNILQLIAIAAIGAMLIIALSLKPTEPTPMPVVKELKDFRLFDSWSKDIDLNNGYVGVEYYDFPLKSEMPSPRIREFSIVDNKLLSISFQEEKFVKCFDLDAGALLFELPNQLLHENGIMYPAGFAYDAGQQCVMVGDAGSGRIFLFDVSGNLLETVEIGIHFVDFSYSAEKERFIVYAPQAASDNKPVYGRNAIHIFDKKAAHLKSLFPVHEACKVLNFATSGSFVKYDGAVYFNPPFKGSVFKINYDGTSELVYDAPFAEVDEIKIAEWVKEVKGGRGLDLAFINHIRKCLPFERFLVTDKYFILEKKFYDFPHSIIVERSSGRSVVVGQRIQLPNGANDHFNFFFSEPVCSADGKLISYITRNNLERIFSSLAPGVQQRLIQKVKGGGALDDDLLMIYDVDFDFLYQNASANILPLISKQPGHESPTAIYRRLDGLELAPNPASQTLRVSTIGSVEIRLYALSGQLMEHTSVRAQPGEKMYSEINLDDFPSGIYLVKVFSEDENAIDSRAIVVSR